VGLDGRRLGNLLAVTLTLEQQVTSIELVDRVRNKGAVLEGDVPLCVGGVDLVYLGLRLLLTSIAAFDRTEADDAA
jgi:gas vesicle structural protein